MPWRLAAFGYAADDDLVALRHALREHARTFDFASVVLHRTARTPACCFAQRMQAPCSAEVIAAIDTALGLDADDVLRYDDGKRGLGRRFRIVGGELIAVRLSGDVDGRSLAARLARGR